MVTSRECHHPSRVQRSGIDKAGSLVLLTFLALFFSSQSALEAQGDTGKKLEQKSSAAMPTAPRLIAPKKPEIWTTRDPDLVRSLEETLEAQRGKFPAKAQIQIAVRDLESGQILYRTPSADQPGNLASVTKMITAAAALHFLGPDFVFQTRLHAGGRHKNSVDSIVLSTSGDPTLTEANLAALALAARRQGIKKTKRVEIVLPAMGIARFPPEFDTKNTEAAYRAPVGGFNLNQNRIMIHIKPGATVGSSPKVSITPSADGVAVVNRAKTRAGKADKIEVAVDWGKAALPTITVRGSIGVHRKAGVTGVRLNRHPERWAAETFRTLLARSGLKVPAKAKILNAMPKGTYRITKYESAPLSEIVRHMLKFSDNQAAEILLLRLVRGSGHDLQEPITRVHAWLKAMGIRGDALVIRNGSGLYNGSSGSALAVTDLLARIYNRRDIGPEFLAALAVPGRPGTLEQRLQHLRAGAIRGKTGTLNEVSTLCGFALGQERKTAFCVLLNGLKKAHRSDARALQDRVAETLLKPRPK